jgi:hypothetical protein
MNWAVRCAREAVPGDAGFNYTMRWRAGRKQGLVRSRFVSNTIRPVSYFGLDRPVAFMDFGFSAGFFLNSSAE